VRSIIRLFEKLLFEEQKEALKQLQAAHEHSRSAKRAAASRYFVQSMET